MIPAASCEGVETTSGSRSPVGVQSTCSKVLEFGILPPDKLEGLWASETVTNPEIFSLVSSKARELRNLREAQVDYP